MGDRAGNNFSGLYPTCKEAHRRFGFDVNELREKATANILKENAWQEPRLTQDLKAVTDTEHPAPFLSEISYGVHNGRKLSERTRAKVITVREATWKNNEVRLFKIRVAMPNRIRFGFEELAENVHNILVAVCSWEYNDRDSH
jgi:hypothetical protein